MSEDVKQPRRQLTVEEFRVALSKLTLPPSGSSRAGQYDQQADYTWICCRWCGE